jgi:hypothetical protein
LSGVFAPKTAAASTNVAALIKLPSAHKCPWGKDVP